MRITDDVLTMSPRIRQMLGDQYWRELVRLSGSNAAVRFVHVRLPQRFDPQYAATQLGHVNQGADGLPFFTALVRSPSRSNRWIDGAMKSEIRVGASKKTGVTIGIKMPVPNVVHKKTRRRFGTLSQMEAKELSQVMRETARESLRMRTPTKTMKFLHRKNLASYRPVMVSNLARVKALLIGKGAMA